MPGEVEEGRVRRCNLAVNILVHSSKNYCICRETFICFAKIFLFKHWTIFLSLTGKCLPLHFSIALLTMENENCWRYVPKCKMIQFNITVGRETASELHNAYGDVQ